MLTALSVAAGGNVTGGMGQLVQNAAVAYLQELGTNEVKQLADQLGYDTARAALHAIVGCAGAAASGQSCGAGAMGAATSSVIGSLLKPSDGMSASDREARDNLVSSLVAGIAAVSGLDTATAAGAGKIEVENNQVGKELNYLPILKRNPNNPLNVDLIRTFCAQGTCTDEQVKQLLDVQNQISANNAVLGKVAGSAAIVAAVPALAFLSPEMLAVALVNPTLAVNLGIITTETAAAIATNSVTPGSAVEVAEAKAGQAAAKNLSRDVDDAANVVRNQSYANGASASTSPGTSSAGSSGGSVQLSATNGAAAGGAADMTSSAQLRTQLSLQQAGILDSNGQLTAQAIKGSDPIPLADGGIKNPSVVSELTSDGSNIADWGKYTTQSVTMPNGQSMQVHYYMNSVTGKVDYVTPDFKVKGVVKP